MKKSSEFRTWVEKIWRENCQERWTWHEDQLPVDQYFARYKYWLKREYRYQKALDR